MFHVKRAPAFKMPSVLGALPRRFRRYGLVSRWNRPFTLPGSPPVAHPCPPSGQGKAGPHAASSQPQFGNKKQPG
jgi:hypothetical protein